MVILFQSKTSQKSRQRADDTCSKVYETNDRLCGTTWTSGKIFSSILWLLKERLLGWHRAQWRWLRGIRNIPIHSVSISHFIFSFSHSFIFHFIFLFIHFPFHFLFFLSFFFPFPICRHKSLQQQEQKRLEVDEDRILSTVLYNLVAFMISMDVDKTAIKKKVRRLIGKSHIGLHHGQPINDLLDNIQNLVRLPVGGRAGGLIVQEGEKNGKLSHHC